jgi:hypothetical protein
MSHPLKAVQMLELLFVYMSDTIVPRDYSTVTLFARFLGWSTSQPLLTAMW